MFVDSHVNLHGDRYADDLDEVRQRAIDAGVGAMLAISDRLDSGREIEAIVRDWREQNYPIWRSVGVHPHHAKDHVATTTEDLIARSQPDDVVGIGECGLDFHYEYSDRDSQDTVFTRHVEASQETGLPLIIHTRNADEAMADHLSTAHARRPFTPLLHCYTGGPELAELVLSLGGYVAFSGIITFKKAEDVRAVAKMIPLDRILIETDCPFLAPVPHRGKRNEPAFLPYVAETLATIKGVDIETVRQATTDAFFSLFSRAERPG